MSGRAIILKLRHIYLRLRNTDRKAFLLDWHSIVLMCDLHSKPSVQTVLRTTFPCIWEMKNLCAVRLCWSLSLYISIPYVLCVLLNRQWFPNSITIGSSERTEPLATKPQSPEQELPFIVMSVPFDGLLAPNKPVTYCLTYGRTESMALSSQFLILLAKDIYCNSFTNTLKHWYKDFKYRLILHPYQ